MPTAACRTTARYALDLNGHIAVDAARGLNLHGPAAEVLTRMSGSAPYDLSVSGAKGRLPEVIVNSDLSGLALDFPAPFNKPLGKPMPLHFTFKPAATDSDASLQRADLQFGPIAATYLLRHTPNQPPTVVVGAIGVNKPAELPTEGVIAAVDIDAFDADQWRALVTQMRSKQTAAPATPASAPNPTLAQFLPNRFAVAHRHPDAAQAPLGKRDRRRLARQTATGRPISPRIRSQDTSPGCPAQPKVRPVRCRRASPGW